MFLLFFFVSWIIRIRRQQRKGFTNSFFYFLSLSVQIFINFACGLYVFVLRFRDVGNYRAGRGPGKTGVVQKEEVEKEEHRYIGRTDTRKPIGYCLLYTIAPTWRTRLTEQDRTEQNKRRRRKGKRSRKNERNEETWKRGRTGSRNHPSKTVVGVYFLP